MALFRVFNWETGIFRTSFLWFRHISGKKCKQNESKLLKNASISTRHFSKNRKKMCFVSTKIHQNTKKNVSKNMHNCQNLKNPNLLQSMPSLTNKCCLVMMRNGTYNSNCWTITSSWLPSKIAKVKNARRSNTPLRC